MTDQQLLEREKVYREQGAHQGIIFMRLTDERAVGKIEGFASCLKVTQKSYRINLSG